MQLYIYIYIYIYIHIHKYIYINGKAMKCTIHQKLKLPYSPNPEGMVFKTVGIFIGCFAINLSSSLMKILPIHNTVEDNAGDPF